jgi:hypothetical protein
VMSRPNLAWGIPNGGKTGGCTAVAGICVLGSQLVVLRKDFVAGTTILVLGTALWVVLMYGVFALLITGRENVSIARGIDGSWLLGTVCTQSISVLASLQAPGARPVRKRSAVLFPVHVSRKRHAVHHDHNPHILPTHILRGHAARADRSGGEAVRQYVLPGGLDFFPHVRSWMTWLVSHGYLKWQTFLQPISLRGHATYGLSKPQGVFPGIVDIQNSPASVFSYQITPITGG